MSLLSPLDAAFLEAEDADERTSMAIASVAVFEGPAPTYDEFVTAISGRLPLVPKYRQKVRRVPLELAAPRWVDDPAFDVRRHIHERTLPRPGGDRELSALIGEVMSARLERDRPLWDYTLVRRVRDGRWALVSKVHHCMVDGVSGTDLYRVILDETPQPRGGVPDDWHPGGEPTTLGLAVEGVRSLASAPVEQLRGAWAAVRRPADSARRVRDAVRGLPRYAGALVPFTSSSLAGTIGAGRCFAIGRATLDDVALVRSRLGGTMNDVVLAAVTGGFRAVLLERGEHPQPHTVRSLVPVSVRAPGEEGIYENRVSAMLAYLPVHLADPVERLAAVREHLAALKGSGEAEAGETLTTVARHEPFPLVSVPVRMVFHVPQWCLTTVTTNVPGPSRPVYALGRRAVEIIPYVPIADRLRFGVAIFSYCGGVTFGVTGDRDAGSDVGVLAHGIEASLAELVAASRTS